MSTTHTFLRSLRAVARSIQADTRPNFQAALDALEIWRSTIPAPGRRILSLIRSAKTAHRRGNTEEALAQLGLAIKVVELAQKKTEQHSKQKSTVGV